MGLKNRFDKDNHPGHVGHPPSIGALPLNAAHDLEHDDYVVVSFEVPKVKEVLRHAFSSGANRNDYRPASGAAHRADGINKERGENNKNSPPDIWVVFDPELCLFSFKKGSPTVPIFLASSGQAASKTVAGVEFIHPIQCHSPRVWTGVMEFMMQANQGQGIFYALSSEELRDHLDHRQAFLDVRFHADRIEWCTTSGLCLGTYSISEKR